MHEWMIDPEHRSEGYVCLHCGVTEAEMEAANGRLDRCDGTDSYEPA